MKVYCIIGAGYGDEGKGMWVDYRARTNSKSLVIRANSGGQVGHTVVRNGKRHIFSHLGSGTLAGAPTLFTRYSVVNPMLFNKEVGGRNKDIPFELFIDLATPVSTPYDMLLNQVMEIRRGADRHGSCGTGFGVTLEREEQGILLHFSDLISMTYTDFITRLNQIKRWCFDQMGDPQKTDDDFIKQAYGYYATDISKMFLHDCMSLCANATPWKPTTMRLTDYDTLIFENGQGLLLDQDYGTFPHVTRSNTGFRNIGKVLKNNGLFNKVPVTVDYISRCYTTRHGAGPLPHERVTPIGIDVNDPTNVFNEYQQNLRFAPLNLYDIDRAIEWDKKCHPTKTITNRIITCCDQIVNDTGAHLVEYVTREDGLPKLLTVSNFMDMIRSEFNVLVGSPEGP